MVRRTRNDWGEKSATPISANVGLPGLPLPGLRLAPQPMQCTRFGAAIPAVILPLTERLCKAREWAGLDQGQALIGKLSGNPCCSGHNCLPWRERVSPLRYQLTKKRSTRNAR